MENKNYFYKNVVQRKENKNELFNSKLTFQHFFLYLKKNYFIIQYNFPPNMTTVHHRHK